MPWRYAVAYTIAVASIISILFGLLRIGWWPFELFTAFLLQATLALVILSYLIIRSKKKRLATVLVIASAAGFMTLFPFARNEPFPGTFSTCCTYVNVGHANLFSHSKGIATLRKWAAEHDIDILEITELPGAETIDLQQEFPEYPFVLAGNQRGRRKVAILSKYPLTAITPDSPTILGAVAQLDDQIPLAIITTHPTIPMSPYHMARRDAAIKAVFVEAAKHHNAVVTGDFNATPWSPALYTTSQKYGFKRSSGGVFTSTWITPAPLIGLPIDHIYVSSTVSVYQSGIGPFIFSDHWPIYATVAVPKN